MIVRTPAVAKAAAKKTKDVVTSWFPIFGAIAIALLNAADGSSWKGYVAAAITAALTFVVSPAYGPRSPGSTPPATPSQGTGNASPRTDEPAAPAA